LAILSIAGVMASGAALAKPPVGDSLKIDIEASIGERCGISALGAKSKDAGRIDTANSVSFNFKLDCNTPFRIGVAAQNGAMQLVSSEGASTEFGGFATRKSYVAGLAFNTDQDGLVDAGECDSAKLSAAQADCDFYGAQPGKGFSAGRRSTAIGTEGSLTVRWSGSEGDTARLVAGTYEETLTIVVGPRT
jgi:hypothetical protein